MVGESVGRREIKKNSRHMQNRAEMRHIGAVQYPNYSALTGWRSIGK